MLFKTKYIKVYKFLSIKYTVLIFSIHIIH